MKPNAPFSAIVVAGGRGSRSGGPKQWRSLAGKPVVRWSVETLVAAGAEQVIVVIPAGAEPEAHQALAGLDRVKLAIGGKERKDSVLAGLRALSCAADQVVLVHDAARPFLTTEHIERIFAATAAADGALLALAVTDTLKRAEPDGVVLATQTRQGLYRAQTPQAFAKGRLQSALENWAGDTPPTDDAEAVERLGGRVIIVPGDPQLMKLTYPEDFALAESWISERRETRVGQGFDVHAWGPGEAAWLCGVKIDHDQSLIGHSDADAGLHAVTDALLGALGDGDIGDHFPPTDPQWRGAPSKVFAAFAAERVRSAGGRILNVDVTLICERPKIKPHRQAMRAALADILAIDIARISVKATTTEKLGFTGRGEGLAAQAVAAIEIPGGRP